MKYILSVFAVIEPRREMGSPSLAGFIISVFQIPRDARRLRIFSHTRLSKSSHQSSNTTRHSVSKSLFIQ